MSNRPASQQGASARLDDNGHRDSRADESRRVEKPSPANLRDACTCSSEAIAYATGPNGRRKVSRTGRDHRLHVHRNARMHLRWPVGSDTMTLRRRRIVISRMRLEPLSGSAVLEIGWSDHDLRAATPAAERGPGCDAGPAQSPVSRSCARRQWSPLPGVHHPRHRHTGGTLALPDSRGRRGGTGQNLTGTQLSLTTPPPILGGGHPGSDRPDCGNL